MKRLLRDIKFQKGWLIAVVILIAFGAGIYSSFRSSYDSGSATLDRIEDELNAPDIIVSTMPTSDLSSDIDSIGSIAMVSPAFLTECYTFADGKEVRGELNGVELGNRVENYYIIRGKDIESDTDVVVEHHFADQHNIKVGEELTLYINGKPVKFTVCGICFSPSHIIIFSPEGGFIKDLGVFYVHRTAVTKFVNTLYIKVAEHKIDQIASTLKSFFVKKGINVVVQPKYKIFSRIGVREDMGAMNSMANLISPLILGISSFILFVVLSRLVERKRREIGTLRAMGFSKWSIFLHYLSVSGISAVGGIVLSIPLGFVVMALMMEGWAVHSYGLPSQFLAYKLPNLAYTGYASIFVVIFSMLGASLPSYRAASLTPAEAMRPYIGYKTGTRLMSKSITSPTKKLVIRNIFGHSIRSVGTIVATALVLSLGLGIALSIGSFKNGINERFDKNELWDIRVNFNTPQMGMMNLSKLRKLSGVERVEPYTGGAAEIAYKDKSTIIQINVLSRNTRMHSFSFAHGRPSNGIIISGDVANRLGAAVDDRIVLSVPFGPTIRTKVAGIINEIGSSQGYMLENLPFCMGALLKVKNGKVKQVEQSIQNLPFIKSSVRKEDLRTGWLGLMHIYMGMVYSMDFVMVILVLIIIGVLGFISVREREWEFIILKAMGYSNQSIILNSLICILPLSTIGVLLGIPLCMKITALFNATFKNIMAIPSNYNLFLPDVISIRAILVIGFSLLAVFMVTRSSLRRNVAERLRKVFETI